MRSKEVSGTTNPQMRTSEGTASTALLAGSGPPEQAGMHQTPKLGIMSTPTATSPSSTAKPMGLVSAATTSDNGITERLSKCPA